MLKAGLFNWSEINFTWKRCPIQPQQLSALKASEALRGRHDSVESAHHQH